MTIDDVLIINSYAGSLTIAAKRAGVKIRGSYEDAGYGIKIQKANFPGVDFRDTRKDWPTRQGLSKTVVLAHPPCAAFSSQNMLPVNRDKQGVDAPKFQCTVDVMAYAMENEAAALAIESVQPALEGAREVHDAVALDHGYTVYRILQDARHFGVAQARKRFWAIFVRNDLVAARGLTIVHKRREVTVGEALAKAPVDEPLTSHLSRIQTARERMRRHASNRQIDALLSGKHGFGRLCSLIKTHFKLDEPTATIGKNWTGRAFISAQPYILDPDKPAPTLLGDNLWVLNGKPLTPSQYKTLMGFPASYKMPDTSQLLFFLSRGVCPPVAEWVLTTVLNGVQQQGARYPSGISVETTLRPGETLDLQYNVEDGYHRSR